MTKITLSIATKKDRKQLLTWFKHYGTASLIRKRVDCYLEHNFTIVAKERNRIVGVLQWYVKENPNDGLAEIEEVFVSKEFRGQGIGSLLIDFMIKTIKKHFKKYKIKPRKVFLFVGKKNIPARKTYEKQGFRHICSVGKLFHDNEEELLYILDLK